MPIHLLAATTTVPDVSIGHVLFQMVLALGVVVGGIYGLAKILARMRAGTARSGGSRNARRATTRGLSVISRQSLGKDLSIAAVRWGEREVLVGISGSTITFLNDARGDEVSASTVPDGADEALDAANLSGGAPVPRKAFTGFSPGQLAAAATRRQDSSSLVPVGTTSRASVLDALRNATLRH